MQGVGGAHAHEHFRHGPLPYTPVAIQSSPLLDSFRSLVTGRPAPFTCLSLFVNFFVHPNATRNAISVKGGYSVLPTIQKLLHIVGRRGCRGDVLLYGVLAMLGAELLHLRTASLLAVLKVNGCVTVPTTDAAPLFVVNTV